MEPAERPQQPLAWGPRAMRHPRSSAGRYDPNTETLREGKGNKEGEVLTISSIDHGALSGLADDDHTQYLLKAGGTMTGAINLAISLENGTSATLAGKNCYVFTFSSGATWTLPSIASTSGRVYIIKNRGSATVTLQRAGADSLYTSTTATSISITAGQAAIVFNDGVYWVVVLDPAGAGGSSIGFVDRETPSGAVNGSNVTFTLASTPIAGSPHVFLNGALQTEGAGNDYTISGTTITFAIAPPTGSAVRVSYRTTTGSVNFVDREVPTGSINSVNVSFVLAHTPTAGAEHVYLSGALQTSGSGLDYTISGATITFTTAPPSGSVLVVSYRY